MRRLFVAAMAFAWLNAPALAHHGGHHQSTKASVHSGKSSVHGRHYARRGGAWCGAYMRRVFGVSDPRLNLARNWAGVGSSAGGPQVGAVVVWPHHVGVIRGGPNGNGEWLVESGNDGGAVRTRYRSLHGAIAFRHVGGGSSFAAAEQPRQRQARYVRSYARSNQNQFVWSPGSSSAITNERRRNIRVAQNWMPNGGWANHW